VQRVGETNNQMPWLPEHGDNSVHKPDAQTRAGTLYAQLAQQQLMAAAGRQHELGNLVRGSYAAAAALEYAQVRLFPMLFASLHVRGSYAAAAALEYAQVSLPPAVCKPPASRASV